MFPRPVAAVSQSKYLSGLTPKLPAEVTQGLLCLPVPARRLSRGSVQGFSRMSRVCAFCGSFAAYNGPQHGADMPSVPGAGGWACLSGRHRQGELRPGEPERGSRALHADE